MNKLILATVLAVGSMGVSMAQDAAATTDFRQGMFKVIGWDMGTLAGMAKGELEFDADKAKKAAARMHEMANSLTEGFVAGTYADSNTKPEVETKAAEFQEKLANFIAESNTMMTAAGAQDTLGPQMGKLGGTCKACHDDFRK